MTLTEEIKLANELGLDRKFVIQAKLNYFFGSSVFYWQFGERRLYKVYYTWPVTYIDIDPAYTSPPNTDGKKIGGLSLNGKYCVIPTMTKEDWLIFNKYPWYTQIGPIKILPTFETEKDQLNFELSQWFKFKTLWKKRGRETSDIDESINTISKRLRFLATKDSPLMPKRKSFDLEQIRRTNIVQLAKYSGMVLIPAGTNRYKSKCPFHNENTPSLTFYQENNTYYCFGCQAGGDVISLYMKINKCNFIEACKALE